jgi:hypothetical protein
MKADSLNSNLHGFPQTLQTVTTFLRGYQHLIYLLSQLCEACGEH